MNTYSCNDKMKDQLLQSLLEYFYLHELNLPLDNREDMKNVAETVKKMLQEFKRSYELRRQS